MITLIRALLLKIGYPILMLFGGVSSNLKERFQRWVIHLNNALIRKSKIKAEKILILLPHCLQINECNIRITNDINNCQRCGRCFISSLIGIAEEHGLKIFVATGGGMARKIVKDNKPDAVIAIACERDLSSGIVDSFPLPVLGVYNQRPQGPCYNTEVNTNDVKEAVHFFISR
ncbi:MAG: DUF116 domain-containing protein [Thermodesulfovibrionales bacterium]|nr:DUF116 domain-containing protein [Thermodesulfovibrionales bacterium]